jgi:predicted thioesterase
VDVRGGAVYDYLHLLAAGKASASVLYTLNVRHFAPLASGNHLKIESPDAVASARRS